MVDVNPADLSTPFMPRESTIVDAIAESRRVADQAMRNNPLVNAIIDQGRTSFRGNYGSDYAWFGEFTPPDKNLLDEFGQPQPQRGIVFWRDDPQGNQAFAMYDIDPKTGVPLRQRIYLHDADGNALFHEGYTGGRSFPDTPIVMYQRESFENPAATWTSDRAIYSGEGHLTGTRIEFRGAWTNSDLGATTVSTYLRVSGNGITINTATTNIANSQNFNIDLDVQTIYDAGQYAVVTVEWHMWRTAGSGSFVPRVYRCRAYSNLTG